MISSNPSKHVFLTDMPRRNGKPTYIGFKSQEGDRGLQEGDGRRMDGGVGDIFCEEAFDLESQHRR
jgi:hypothetical protein